MAQPWRLRHKLSLGLALVVGSVGLLLGGALFGLSSYADTMRVTKRKLDEVLYIAQLRDYIHQLEAAAKPDPARTPLDRDRNHLLEVSRAGQTALRAYADNFDLGENEAPLVECLRKGFGKLENEVDAATAPGVDTQPAGRLIDQAEIRGAYDGLNRDATALFQFQVSHVREAFDRSGANHARSLAVAGSAAALAVVLLATLLYYFRVWVFTPVRALQAGVRRVRAGDFSEPIRLASGDEFQELADEFNAMAVTVQANRREMERQVNDRTRQLVRSERMVSVGFLAAGVAHEINNPLASIAFCAEALERRLEDLFARTPGADADVAAKYLKMMQDEAQRCKEITHKLLDFSRGGGPREPADVTELVRDVVEVARVLPTARGKRIEVRAGGPLVAPVSGPEVKGVVLNVVVNALESMDAGGQLVVSAAARGGVAELTFTDTGCGMTADVLENIFEPFFTKSRTGNGTGLGLATSHLIIDQHGGSIQAASPGPGRGSTFTVRLPLADPSRPAVLPFPAREVAAA